MAEKQMQDSLCLEECQKQLRSLYETSSTVKIVPWDQENAVEIDQVYTTLSWLMEEKKPSGVAQEKLEHYTDIFDGRRRHRTPKRILVHGRPGIGKTVFVQKATFDWSQHRFKGKLGRFDLVLLVKLRDVCNLQDVPAILRASNLLANDSLLVSIDDLYDYVRRHQDKVLLILDGYDEYVYGANNQSPVREIWEKKQLRDCCVVITSRDMKGEGLKNGSDAQFQIDGFDRDRQKEFARRFLKDDQDVKEFFKYLKPQELRDLAEIPLLLLMLCLVWKEKDRGGLPSSRAMVYFQFIQTLFNHMVAKEGGDAVTFTNVNVYKEELCEIGELAFYALLQDSLYFPVNKMPNHILATKLTEAGLFQVLNVSALNPNKAVHFIHKSLQEYLASFFLKEKLLSQKDKNNSLFKVDSVEKIVKMTEVLKFAVEMSEEAAREIVIHLTGMAAKIDGLTEYSFHNESPTENDLSAEERNYLNLCTKSLFCCSADARKELLPSFLSSLGGVLVINPKQLNVTVTENLLKTAAPLMYILFPEIAEYTEQDYRNLITLTQQLNAVIVSCSGEMKASEFLEKYPWRSADEFFLKRELLKTYLYFSQILKRPPNGLPLEMINALISLVEATNKTKINPGGESSEQACSTHALCRVSWIEARNVNRSEVELLSDVLPFLLAPRAIVIRGEDDAEFDSDITKKMLSAINPTNKLERLVLRGLNVRSSAAGFIATILKESPYLEIFDLSFNPQLGEGVDTISKHLRSTPHLEHLFLRRVKMTKEQAQHLTEAAMKHSSIIQLWTDYHDEEGNIETEDEGSSAESDDPHNQDEEGNIETEDKGSSAESDDPHNQGLLEGTVEQLCKDVEESRIEWEDVKGAEDTKSESEIINELNDALRTSDTHRQKAPSEILARGSLATEAYQAALLEGKGYSRRVPVMIIGQHRTGKTSLKRSLKGQLFNRDERSTKGIETDPSYFKVSTDVWRTSKVSEDTEPEPTFLFEYQTAQSIVKTLKKEIPDDLSRNPSGSGTEPSKPHQSRSNKDQAAQLTKSNAEELSRNPRNSGTEPSKVIKKTKELSDEPSSKDSELVENARADLEPAEEPSTEGIDTSLQDSQDHLHGPNLPDDIAALVQKLLENNKEVENEDDIYSIVWDFGGQSVYYVTHPIFLTKRAIYILTCDLSRDPYQTDNAPVKSSMRGNVEDTCCSKTPLDYLDFWMSSVFSLVNPEFAGSPPVFLVCTHSDKPYRSDDPGDRASEVYDVLKNKAYEKLLKGLFVVDNTKSGGKSECQGVIKLREKVLSVAKELPQMNELIPLKWLKFEKILRLLSEEGYKWITIEKARQISSHECGINDDGQFSTLLDFLHDQRVLIHFNETPELENMVILNPQWLIDVFKEVITVKSWAQVEENVVEENIVELWRDLEKGILDEKLLDYVWRPLFDDRENCESLIAIMERFSLLCSLPSDGKTKTYLVPSMLKSPPTDNVREVLDSVRIPSLFVRFGSGRVPAGLFSRLILLFHQWHQDELKCLIKPKLFDNFALFHIRPLQATSVIFLCHSSSIEIVFHVGDVASTQETDINNESNRNASRDIHRQLRLFLECMREKFFWLKHMRYEMCVSCPVCSLQEGSSKCSAHKVRGCDCLHLLTERELQMSPYCKRGIVCADIRIRKEIFLPWFAFVDERESGIPPIQQEHRTAPNQSEKHCAVTTGDTQNVAEVESSLSSKQPSSKGIKRKRTIDSSSVTDQGAVKEGCPTRYELEGLSLKVSDKWQTLGRRLGFDDETLLDFDQKKTSDKAYHMLIAWQNANGLDATYLVLNKALRHKYVELRGLAEEFCCN